MLKNFLEYNLPKVDINEKIKSFDPNNISKEEQSIIENYYTPSRSYIRPSSRKIGLEAVSFDTLSYIVETCFLSSEKERYYASIATVYKFSKLNKDKDKLEELKKELYKTNNSERMNKISFAYCDNLFIEGSFIFFILNIKIGKNKIVYFGKTTNRFRRELIEIKKEIKKHYKTQLVEIDIALAGEAENKKILDDILIEIEEHDFKNTNYVFKNSKHTFRKTNVEHMEKVINNFIEKEKIDIKIKKGL